MKFEKNTKRKVPNQIHVSKSKAQTHQTNGLQLLYSWFGTGIFLANVGFKLGLQDFVWCVVRFCVCYILMLCRCSLIFNAFPSVLPRFCFLSMDLRVLSSGILLLPLFKASQTSHFHQIPLNWQRCANRKNKRGERCQRNSQSRKLKINWQRHG